MKKEYCINTLPFDLIKRDIDKYFDIFLKYGLVCFKDSSINILEQKEITELFAKKLNCNYVSSQDNEDHSFTFDKTNKLISKNELFIPWHIEHVQKERSQIAASWNMLLFECSSGVGDTGFINAINLYNNMPDKWKLFLNECDVINKSRNYLPRKCIQNHIVKDEKILRLSPNNEDILYAVNKNKPSEKDIELFNEIVDWYLKEVNNNVEIQNWWQWSKGDLLIVDLSCMIHAVKGGFTPDQRIFSRYWIFINESDYIEN